MAFGRGFKKEKGNKYKNKKVEYDGIKFDSVREKDRYFFLKDAESKGVIMNLQVHKKFELIPSVKEKYVKHLKTKDKECERTLQLPITYTCDFCYVKDGGEVVVEDIKISKFLLPKEYVLKKKMMLALKGIQIREVYKSNEEI